MFTAYFNVTLTLPKTPKAPKCAACSTNLTVNGDSEPGMEEQPQFLKISRFVWTGPKKKSSEESPIKDSWFLQATIQILISVS